LRSASKKAKSQAEIGAAISTNYRVIAGGAVIDTLLKFAKERPQAVIVALLAVLASGAIGGGLYLKALKEGDRVNLQWFGLQEDKKSARIKALEYELEILHREIPDLAQSINQLQRRVAALPPSDRLAVERFMTGFPSSVSSINDRAIASMTALGRADAVREASERVDSAPSSLVGHEPPYLVLLGVLVLSLLGGYVLGSFRARKTHTTR
jgi:hypothetical protein